VTPSEFVEKWHSNTLGERQGAQSHFIDLCDLLGVEKPTDPDNYCFERGATRTGAGNGWADVWKRGCFAWEYKGPGGDLGAALKQLMTYALALDNPPLLVVSDRELVEIHTHFTGTPSETYTFHISDLISEEVLQKLRWVFSEPDRFKPAKTIRQVTEEAASKFAELAINLADRGIDPKRAAHFLNKCLFAMFAEDVKLLNGQLFTRLLEAAVAHPAEFVPMMNDLFAAMKKGGRVGFEQIDWFNGGLFSDEDAIELNKTEIQMLLGVAGMDWSQIEPSIFGTLFERGLDPKKRSQLGAHYTDPVSIMRIVNPVVVEPLRRAWESVKKVIEIIAPDFGYVYVGKKKEKPNDALRKGNDLFLGFLKYLHDFRVLDPACGSGNFLYLSLKSLKDLEHRVNLEAEVLGLHRQISIEVCPANVIGIELNDYAAELARVTVWIGEIQWMLSHGYQIRRNPILENLDHIECRDALINADGTEAEWPIVDAIVGNPPFLGDKKMRGELGNDYVDKLRVCFEGRVPGGADLVTYWFEKARAQIDLEHCNMAGLVATSSIRGGANRLVLDNICKTGNIINAWSDEDWINEGAAVRVSLICFAAAPCHTPILDGEQVLNIHPDLTSEHAAGGSNLTLAKQLTTNAGIAFIGTQKNGPFDISGELARHWLLQPNPHGKPNSEVLRPWLNGIDITRRNTDTWVIDFDNRSLADAANYELPFAHVSQQVRPTRLELRRDRHRNFWWQYGENRPGMRTALATLTRYIATPRVSKYRLFCWANIAVMADSAVVAIARDDDVTFGILQSRFHWIWSLAMGTSLEDRPRYTPTTCFETFPFPLGLTPDLSLNEFNNPVSGDIDAAAKNLSSLRSNWLNPMEWVEHTPEVVPGFPDRVIPRLGHEAGLRLRTLTNLYNASPAWLVNAHARLDHFVAMGYGWNDYTPEMDDDEILKRLLALNLERAD